MNPIIDESYFDLIIDNNIVENYQNGNHVYPLNSKLSLLLRSSDNFSMNNIGTYPYSFFPSLFTLSSTIRSNTNIEKIQSNPNFNLYGKGVLIGIIDTGINYEHSAFRYPDGSSRIIYLWDQTIDNDGVSENVMYGTEYNNSMLNTALTINEPYSYVPSTDNIGHGTMLAGIIGGNYDTENNFKGIVPKCEFLIVKLKPAKIFNKKIFCVPENKLCYEESDIISGLTYITEKAALLHRPLAICIALGTSQGGHNGKGSTSSYLNYINHIPHFGIAVAAGNEGNLKRHFFGKISHPYYTDFELNISPKDYSFSMEIWTASPYRISLDITTPNGETIRGIYPRINECRQIDFIFTASSVWINNILSETDTGDQLILVRFSNAFNGIWRFRAYSIDEEPTDFHVWLPSSDLISNETFLLNSTPDCTLTSPGNSESPLVLANYDEISSSISSDSGRGFTRYNFIKPDLSAPGTDITAPFQTDKYGTISGTGASAAYATGIIAMILEWAIVQGRHRSISGSDINKLLIRGAHREKQNTYPNNRDGYGLIDIYGMFEKLI